MKEKKLTVVEKSWMINFSKIEKGFLYDRYSYCVIAKNVNEAKTKLIEKVRYEGLCLRGQKDEVTYITIPVVRDYEGDRYLYNDQLLTNSEIEKLKFKEARKTELERILSDETITHCYIRKGGYYYGDNNSGYVDRQIYAGVYEKKDAVSKALSYYELRIIPINIIEHNELIMSEINKLTAKIIK